MPKVKVLIIILIAAMLAGLGFVYKNQILDLVSKKLSGNNANQFRATKIETKRIDMADLALPQNFPANFPLPEEAKITESYNLIETKTGVVKVAAIKLSSNQSVDDIKNFYTNKLRPPDFKFVINSDKGNTDIKKNLVFSDKMGILIINLSKEAEGTTIKITKDILAIPTSK